MTFHTVRWACQRAVHHDPDDVHLDADDRGAAGQGSVLHREGPGAAATDGEWGEAVPRAVRVPGRTHPPLAMGTRGGGAEMDLGSHKSEGWVVGGNGAPHPAPRTDGAMRRRSVSLA